MRLLVKLLYISLLSLTFLPCMSMNQPASSKEANYLVEASDGRLVLLPALVLKNLKVLKDYCEFEKDAEWQSEMLLNDIKSKVLFNFQKQYNLISIKNFNLPVTGDLLEKLKDCLSDNQKIKQLDTAIINGLFEAADCLGAPQPFLRKLTKKARKKLSKKEQHPLIRCGHYLNSLNVLIDNGYFNEDNKEKYLQKIKDTNNNDIDVLLLSELELDNLEGIEKVARIINGTKVHAIYLNLNKLTKVDISKFWNLFPYIKEISFESNKIKKACLSQKMPKNFKLNLAKNNKLEKITGKLSEASVLVLDANTINPSLQNCITLITKPSWYQSKQHFVKLMKSRSFLTKLKHDASCYGLLLAVGAPLCGSLRIALENKIKGLSWGEFAVQYPQILKIILTSPRVYVGLFGIFSTACFLNAAVNLFYDQDFFRHRYGYQTPVCIFD